MDHRRKVDPFQLTSINELLKLIHCVITMTSQHHLAWFMRYSLWIRIEEEQVSSCADKRQLAVINS